MSKPLHWNNQEFDVQIVLVPLKDKTAPALLLYKDGKPFKIGSYISYIWTSGIVIRRFKGLLEALVQANMVSAEGHIETSEGMKVEVIDQSLYVAPQYNDGAWEYFKTHYNPTEE